MITIFSLYMIHWRLEVQSSTLVAFVHYLSFGLGNSLNNENLNINMLSTVIKKVCEMAHQFPH